MNIPLLTQGESKVYLALVELGETSVGNALKRSGVSHSKIYDILQRLSEKGLVSTFSRGGKQFFSPSEPKTLLSLLQEEKGRIEDMETEIIEVIKSLELSIKTASPKSIISSFEGIPGMKAALEDIQDNLSKGDEVLIFGTPRKINVAIGGYLKDWQKRRIAKGAVCRLIADPDSPSWDEDWWLKSKEDKLTFTKRGKAASPAYMIITRNSVTTIYFASQVFTYTIRHEEITKRYIGFFNDAASPGT